MHRFLPRRKDGSEWGFARGIGDTDNRFVEADSACLKQVGCDMYTGSGEDTPYAPTPYSRALTFQRLLLSDADDNLKKTTRQAFRGVWAVLALRKLLKLEVRVEKCPINPGISPLRKALGDAISQIPNGDQESAFWLDMPYLAIGPKNEKNVLCGLSTKTIIYPAACPTKGLDRVFWYTCEEVDIRDDTGQLKKHRLPQWSDPTAEGAKEEGRDVVAKRRDVKRWMLAWLEGTVNKLPTQQGDGNVPTVLGFPVDVATAIRLRKEFDLWREELQGEKPLGSPVQEQLAAGNGMACSVVDAVLNVDTPETIFTPALVEVDALSEGWFGVSLPMPDNKPSRCFLLPFQYAFAHGKSLSDLKTATTIESIYNSNEQFKVTCEWNGETYAAAYSEFPEELRVHKELQGCFLGHLDTVTFMDGKLDVRVFPDFYVDPVTINPLPNILAALYQEFEYYVRVRSNPSNKVPAVYILKKQAGLSSFCKVERTASDDGKNDMDRDPEAPDFSKYKGVAHFYRLMLPDVPCGIFVEGCGFAFFDAKPIAVSAHSQWTVAIDFGTANTCIAVKPPNAGQGHEGNLRLFSMSSAMANKTKAKMTYSQTPFEDYQSYLDFFTIDESDSAKKVDKRTGLLNGVAYTGNYFPSQFVTSLTSTSPKTRTPIQKLLITNGLVYYNNFSLGEEQLSSLVQSKKTGLDTPFHLFGNIKWKRTQWRFPFMVHLRKMLVLSIARQGGVIGRAIFSHPRAFDKDLKSAFNSDVNAIWAGYQTDCGISESEAMYAYFSTHPDAVGHLVLDIGGGTTDILAMGRNRVCYQSSFELAANQINKFVERSHYFRLALLCAAEKVGCHSQTLNSVRPHFECVWDEHRDNSFIGLAWLGLMQGIAENAEAQSFERMIEALKIKTAADPDGDPVIALARKKIRGSGGAQDSNLDEAKEKEKDKVIEGELRDAIARFFASVLVLFTSLAFFAGRLLAEAASNRGRGGRLNDYHLHLSGNGAKLFDFIKQLGRDEVELLMKEMVEAGFKASGFEDDSLSVTFKGIPQDPNTGEKKPKEMVALGAISLVAGGNPHVETGYLNEDVEFFEKAGGVTFQENSLICAYFAALKSAGGKKFSVEKLLPYATENGVWKLSSLGYSDRTLEEIIVAREKNSRTSYQKYDLNIDSEQEAARSREPRFISHIISFMEKSLIAKK